MERIQKHGKMVSPKKTVEEKKVKYTEENWERLEDFRKEAKKILSALKEYDLKAFAHGSIARGDMKKDSDIDIIIPRKIPSFKIELALQEKDFDNYDRRIVMATPWHLPKVHYDLGGERMVTVPLEKPKELEEDFYRFGGIVDFQQIENNERVSGVDKRLVLIEPIKDGHKEKQVFGKEGEVAKKLGVSVEIVEERVEVLTKREEIGRTGIFLEKKLTPSENVETVWEHIRERNPEISKRNR